MIAPACLACAFFLDLAIGDPPVAAASLRIIDRRLRSRPENERLLIRRWRTYG